MTKASTGDSSEAPKTAIVGNFTDSKTNMTKNEVKSVSPLTSIDEVESTNGNHKVVKNTKRRRSSFKKKGMFNKKYIIKFLDSAGFQAYMFVCLVLALFAVDVIALHSYGDDVTEAMNIILMLVFASYGAEMVLNFFIRDADFLCERK